MATVGSGRYTYELIENWGKLPAGETFGMVSAIATDSLVMIGVRSYSGGGPDCVHSRADHDTPPLRGPMPRRDRRMGAGVVV